MVPLSSLRIPRAHRYSVHNRTSDFAYRTLTFFGWASHPILLSLRLDIVPQSITTLVRPLPLSLAATHRISFDFSSSPYLDVSVREVPLLYLLIQYNIYDSSSYVFPHSEICGSKLICSSPQLIAACHVLLRLSMPRHSPYALYSLNVLSFSYIALSFVQ